jgi:predicted O-methyltransferase YrrM
MDARDFKYARPGYPRAALDLLSAYGRHPSDFFRHIRHVAKPPIESGLPMLTFGAIDFLSNRLRSDMTAFEFGCGGSTLFFARHCQFVVAIEDRPKWRERVAAAAAERNAKNVTILVKPRAQHVPALSQPYDVILVDGAADRRVCFDRADAFVAPDGMVILDDAWWPLGIVSQRAKTILQFPGVGPYRYLPSRTDIYLY